MATTIKDADDFKDNALLVAVKRIAYFSCMYFFIIIYSLTFRSLVSEAGTVNSEHVTNLSLGTSGNVVQRTSCHWSCGAHLFYFYVGNFYLVFYQLFTAVLFSIFFIFSSAWGIYRHCHAALGFKVSHGKKKFLVPE